VITLVLDASVAVKWAIPLADEPLTDESLRLFQLYRNGEFDFIVPDIFWAELGNALWKGVRRGRWAGDDAQAVISDFARRDFTTVSTQMLVSEALQIALSFQRNIYACLYAALARESKANLISADGRLANALAARFPVKWLGAIDTLL
jgi:predicted nucleic acid-binding protein